MHERFRSEPFNVVTCLPEVLSKPLHWRKPRVVFIDCADLFHKDVPFEFIERVYAVMEEAHWHTYLICTKRPQRRLDFFRWLGGGEMRPHERENVWEGVTAEDQQRADERIPLLLATPAAHRWVSIEPALSHVRHDGLGDVDQVVWGGESGRGMRYACQTWARDLLRDLTDTATSVFIKQIHDGKRLVTDPAQFPEGLRVRDLAWHHPAADRRGQ